MAKIINKDKLEVPIGSHMGKTIIIGSDHRGYKLKEEIKNEFKKNYKIIDVGTNSEDRCDYPFFSNEIGKFVSEDHLNKVGIGICGSGMGIIIPAGKHKTIIATRCLSIKDAESSRKHNNSNVLGISADKTSLKNAIEIIQIWLETPFYFDQENEEEYLNRYIQTRKFELKT
jgi:RpiB/LacA/LacB family sugar-phosphate isomerase